MNYRKIYEKHHGKIPKDSNGRSMEIHHINGDHSDNRIENLKLVTIDEHYQIHYNQGDWPACHALSMRMAMTSSEISKLAKLSAKTQIAKGNHNFLGGAIQHKRVQNGTHHLLSGDIQRKANADMLAKGIHPFQKIDRKKTCDRQMAEGTHNFQTKKTCPHCGKTLTIGPYHQWHGDKCKFRQKGTIT